MIGELEDAIVERINLLKPHLSYQLPTVEAYGGQINENRQSTFKFPAVFVTYHGHKQTKQLGERGRVITVNLILYVATRNPRNERARRQGDLHEVGSYQLAEDMIAALENQRLGMPMLHPLRHTQIETIFIAAKSDGANAESILAVYFECEFVWSAALPECAFIEPGPEFEQNLQDLVSTQLNFYLKPGDADAAPALGAEVTFNL